MGVSGLTKLLNHHGNILEDFKFSESKLVVDGSNLFHSLYFKSRLDQKHGGDYDDFEDQVCKFFKALRDCGIKPYVIIDGGSDHTDKKFKTLKNRAESKIKNAKALTESNNLERDVLPALVKYVFKQVLSSLNVPFTQCICEADQGIALLARNWKCPVLSDDSDFYIFDIVEGCLPISHFQWQETSVSQRYIKCKRYTTTRFSQHFNINKQLLPVFAVMVGNDNVYFGITWEDNEDKPRVGSKVRQAEERFPTLERILKWLASVQEKKKALELMPSLIGDKNADVVSRGMIDYDIPETLPSYLEGFFSNDVAPGLDCLPTPLRVLPDWTLLLLMKGKLPSRIVNVLLHKRVMQSAQVENHALVSGNTTSQFIRQVLYGLLLLGSSPVKEHDRKGKNLRTDGRKADPSSQKVSEVKEYDREGTELTYRMVKAILPSAAQHLQLDTLDKAPHSVRLEVFLETLRVSQSTLNGIPPHLELPVAVTYYWLRHAHPQPDRPLLQALLLGLVYGEFCRERKCQGVEAEGPVLERLRELTQNPVGADLNLGVAHAYSQWQCCLREGLNLNQLLCFPLTEPQCAWLYRGTLVHQLVDQLRRGVNPDSLLMEVLSSMELYQVMLDNLKDCYEGTGRKEEANEEGWTQVRR